MRSLEFHDFYCISCGQKVISLPRKKGHQHKDGHRKKLYCPWCKKTFNCVETKDFLQAQHFRLDFEEGKFKEELAQYE